MSEQPQSGTGKTAGLPGGNADPRTSDITDDERDETVAAAADVAPLSIFAEGSDVRVAPRTRPPSPAPAEHAGVPG